VTTVYRVSQNLGGSWESFSSLREAWVYSNEANKDDAGFLAEYIQRKSIILPSNQGFKVAVKHFEVSGSWGTSPIQLVFNGLRGKVRVFLNGIDEVNYLGELEGWGNTCSLDIPPTMFDYRGENTFYLEMSPGSMRQRKFLGWLWPEQGRITGRIELEAIPETTIDVSKTTVNYKAKERQVAVNVSLKHHQTLKNGPWSLSGVIKDQNRTVAECVLPIDLNGQYEQTVDLLFDMPEVKLWSPDNHFLYQLELKVTNKLGQTDQVQVPIGLNYSTGTTSAWAYNGQKIPVRARIITGEQDYDIRNKQQIESFLRDVKGAGYNVVYFMGFFPDESWLFAADKLGVGVWLELPVSFVPELRIPSRAELESLILMAGRHPCVMAWTLGQGLQNSGSIKTYLQEIEQRLSPQPVYYLDLLDSKQAINDDTRLTMGLVGFSGSWGKADYLPDQDLLGSMSGDTNWPEQKIIACCWLGWLLLLWIQNRRAPRWKYGDLFNPQPKRGLRRAFFWCCLQLLGKYGTWAGLMTSIIFLSFSPPPWFPYDLSWLVVLRQQQPLLVWLFLTALLLLLRFFQVGLAATGFPGKPGTAALCCWLDYKNSSMLLLGLTWVLMIYNYYWFIPFALYLLAVVLFLPWRARRVRRAGGKYSRLSLLPLTFVFVAGVVLLRHYPDIAYLGWLLDIKIDHIKNSLVLKYIPW
ncbi:MAG: beta-galactosidase, partial [Peptococcaceae bacterium]|nr:beta-galactosidase [Peptococcaceae bacterium]